MSTKRHLHLLFEGKPDFGTCCFPSLGLCVNGHIFTHFIHYYALHSTISQLMSHPPVRPVLMVITPGRFDVHLFLLPKKLQAVKFWKLLKPVLWSLAIFVEAVTPVCSSSKYFLGVTHVRTVGMSPGRLICPPLLRCSSVCLHDTFLIKKIEKQLACLNNSRKRYASNSPFRWDRGEEECSWSSARPEMAEQRHSLMLVHVSWGEG